MMAEFGDMVLRTIRDTTERCSLRNIQLPFFRGVMGLTEENPNFTAAAPATGYFYQARLALALALDKANQAENVEIAIERLDDISFEKDGTPIELLQTKHHIDRQASLTDGSPDIWKTLRVWSVAAQADPGLPLKTKLFLVTTGSAPEGSAAWYLRPSSSYPDGKGRDPSKAEQLLTDFATTSGNKELKAAFAAFCALHQKMRISLLSAVEVLDNHISLTDLEAQIEQKIKFIAPKERLAEAREVLEGWWFARIFQALKSMPAQAISLSQLEAKIDDVREAFKRSALVYDYEGSEPTEQEAANYDGFPFVSQLHAVGVGGNRIAFAKRDFYRAFNQRSKWTRDHAVLDDELANYERTLIEEWQPRFSAMVDGLADGASDSEVRQAGAGIYAWVENQARFPLRAVETRSLCVGSYHILSNKLSVGWHRDFATLCEEKDT